MYTLPVILIMARHGISNSKEMTSALFFALSCLRLKQHHITVGLLSYMQGYVNRSHEKLLIEPTADLDKNSVIMQ